MQCDVNGCLSCCTACRDDWSPLPSSQPLAMPSAHPSPPPFVGPPQPSPSPSVTMPSERPSPPPFVGPPQPSPQERKIEALPIYAILGTVVGCCVACSCLVAARAARLGRFRNFGLAAYAAVEHDDQADGGSANTIGDGTTTMGIGVAIIEQLPEKIAQPLLPFGSDGNEERPDNIELADLCSFLTSSPAPIIIVDRNHKITHWSPCLLVAAPMLVDPTSRPLSELPFVSASVATRLSELLDRLFSSPAGSSHATEPVSLHLWTTHGEVLLEMVARRLAIDTEMVVIMTSREADLELADRPISRTTGSSPDSSDGTQEQPSNPDSRVSLGPDQMRSSDAMILQIDRDMQIVLWSPGTYDPCCCGAPPVMLYPRVVMFRYDQRCPADLRSDLSSSGDAPLCEHTSQRFMSRNRPPGVPNL